MLGSMSSGGKIHGRDEAILGSRARILGLGFDPLGLAHWQSSDVL